MSLIPQWSSSQSRERPSRLTIITSLIKRTIHCSIFLTLPTIKLQLINFIIIRIWKLTTFSTFVIDIFKLWRANAFIWKVEKVWNYFVSFNPLIYFSFYIVRNILSIKRKIFNMYHSGLKMEKSAITNNVCTSVSTQCFWNIFFTPHSQAPALCSKKF